MTDLSEPAGDDPVAVFLEWRRSVADAAACLSTVTAQNRPSARIVLVRGADRHGFHFFTSHASPKAQQLAGNPAAAMTWYWPPTRQVRAEGAVVPMEATDSDRLWSERPRDAQLQVLAFEQSAPVRSRAQLERALRDVASRVAGVESLPRPADWGAFTLVPDLIEFWTQREDRIHDRHRYRRVDDGWITERLAP